MQRAVFTPDTGPGPRMGRRLRGCLDGTTYASWMGPLQLRSMSRGCLCLGAPNPDV